MATLPVRLTRAAALDARDAVVHHATAALFVLRIVREATLCAVLGHAPRPYYDNDGTRVASLCVRCGSDA